MVSVVDDDHHVSINSVFFHVASTVSASVPATTTQDLPSEDIDPPTAAGSSSTLSKSQYTHVHKL